MNHSDEPDFNPFKQATHQKELLEIIKDMADLKNDDADFEVKIKCSKIPKLLQIENEINELMDGLHIESEQKVLFSELIFADSYF